MTTVAWKRWHNGPRCGLFRGPRSVRGMHRALQAVARRPRTMWRAVQWPPPGTLFARLYEIVGGGMHVQEFTEDPDDVTKLVRYAARRRQTSERVEALVRELGLEKDVLACEVMET